MTNAVMLNNSNHPYLETALGVLGNEAAAIQALVSCLDETFIKVIDRALSIKGRLIITGMGKSGHIAKKISATLSSTGQPSLFVHPAEASHGDMGMIVEDDMVIALSNSGETHELANIIEYTRRFRIPLVGMTRDGTSSLSRVADYSLVIPNYPEACVIGLAPTTSTTMMLVLGDAIAVTLLKARGFTTSDFRVYHPGGNLGIRLKKVSENMHSGNALPLVNTTTLMSDVIVTMSVKGFGCIGVVDNNNHLLGIITDGDLRRHMHPALLEQKAGDIMTVNPTTIEQTMLMNEALAIINESKITALFVVENSRPIGIIHIHDFLRAGIA